MKKIMASRVDPDVTARYDPSDQDLHYLQRYLYWSVGMTGLNSSIVRLKEKNNDQPLFMSLI